MRSSRCLVLIELISHFIPSHQSSPCRNGCQLLFHEDLPCDSNHAMVPNQYINSTHIAMKHILSQSAYLCFNLNDAVYIGTDPAAAGSFSLNSYVFLWQSIIIAIVIPLSILILLRLIHLLALCALRSMRCKHGSKCGCIVHCLSAQYRQQRRNEKYHEHRPEEGSWWKWGNRRRASIEQKEDGKEEKLDQHDPSPAKQYLEVPLRDEEEAENVLESVSIGNNEFEKYLEAPGSGGGQGVELSYSSHGLRQISYREVV